MLRAGQQPSTATLAQHHQPTPTREEPQRTDHPITAITAITVLVTVAVTLP
jgi:hypothetical protein